MICEALLFVSAVFLYFKSIYQCFHHRPIDEDVLAQEAPSEHESMTLVSDKTFFYIRVRKDGIPPLFSYDEFIIPMNAILSETNLSTQNEDCPVCLEPLKDALPIRELPCKHCYCETCILQWIKKSPRCPLCNQHVIQQWFQNRNEIESN